jgi:K+-transporting ATPase KdpF subunit
MPDAEKAIHPLPVLRWRRSAGQVQKSVSQPNIVIGQAETVTPGEYEHARHYFRRSNNCILSDFYRVCEVLRSHPLRGNAMDSESIIMLVVSAGLMVYLLYALLRPERF